MADIDYKVLITTSGIGQRLGELTQYTNKALVRIGAKPALSYIIESYPENIPLVITVGHFGNHIKEFTKLVYPKRHFEFVQVDKYEGPGSSLGYSMLRARKNLNLPFIFHACDTIVTEQIPEPDRNWIGGYKGQDASQYTSWSMTGKNQYLLNDKGAADFDYIHIGLVGIKDYEHFWDHLKSLHRTDPHNSSLNDTATIKSMIEKQHRFEIKDFKAWHDIGNIKSLVETRERIADKF